MFKSKFKTKDSIHKYIHSPAGMNWNSVWAEWIYRNRGNLVKMAPEAAREKIFSQAKKMAGDLENSLGIFPMSDRPVGGKLLSAEQYAEWPRFLLE